MNSARDTNSFLKISGCSYEGSLFGWNIVEQSTNLKPTEAVAKKLSKSAVIENSVANNETLDTVLSYGLNVCEGCLRAVAVSQKGKHLVTGGTDERIRIFDLKENHAVGEISTHTGAITSLHFYGDSYLMSGSEDCTLCIWRVHDWQCVHILGGHKGAVTDFSIHPTGKLALSVSKDSTMKLWNLVQGRCAFTRRLKKLADNVLWHESGLYYSLTIGNELQLYLASDNSCVCTINRKSRINKGIFVCINNSENSNKKGNKGNKGNSSSDVSNWRIAVVCEDKSLTLYDFTGAETCSVDLSIVGSGRPRDMWSGFANTSAASDSQVVESIKGHCLVIVTSTGLLLTLNASAMELPAVKNDDDEGEGEEFGVLGNCLLSHHQIKVEPRLTAVVGWSSAVSARNNASEDVQDVVSSNVSAARPSKQNDSDSNQSDDDESEGEERETSQKVKKSKKANKKRKLNNA